MWQKNIHQLPPTCTPTGDRTYDLGMCPDRESNLPPFGVWDDAPTNWAIWPGLGPFFKLFSYTWVLRVFLYILENSLLSNVSCKYFLPVCGLSSHSINSVFRRAELFNRNKVQLINDFFHRYTFGVAKGYAKGLSLDLFWLYCYTVHNSLNILPFKNLYKYIHLILILI